MERRLNKISICRSFLAAFVTHAAVLCLADSRVQADLIGTQVNGSLIYSGATFNAFDPANDASDPFDGGVPPGDLNAAGTTVTIADPAVEFGYQDEYNTDTADFTGSGLTVMDVVGANGALSWTMQFVDTAFTGVSELTDDFPGGITASLSGDTLSLTWPGTYSTGDATNQTFAANFPISVPEPGTDAMLGMGAALLFGILLRRDRRKAWANV